MKTNRIEVGEEFEFKHTFKQKDVNTFAEITGDDNPIHIDADFAAKSIFKKPIVHGFLSGAIFSKVFGTIFPGNGTIYLYQNMKFLKPVFVDIEYVAFFKVKEINFEKGIGIVECTLINPNGELCIEGEAKLKNERRFM